MPVGMAPMFLKGVSGNPKGRKKGSRNRPSSVLRRLMKTRPPDDAIAIVQGRFPELDPSTMAEVVGAVHLSDAYALNDPQTRNAARKSLYAQIEAPPQSAPQVQVNIAVGRSLDSLSCAQADGLPSPAPLLIEAKEMPPDGGEL